MPRPSRPETPRPNSPKGDAATPTSRPRGLLGEVLVARGLVTLDQVGLALQLQATSGKKLGEVLVDMDALDERTLVDALADYFGLDVTDLRRDVPDPAALAMIPEDVAREYLAIPVRLEDRTLTVAVAQPSDDLRFLLSETSGCSVRLRLAPLSDIRWAIDRTYQAIGSLDQYVQAFEAVETTRRRALRRPRHRPRWPRTPPSCRWWTGSSPRRCATVLPTCTSSPRRTPSTSGTASMVRSRMCSSSP